MSEDRLDCTAALDLLQDYLKQEVTPELAEEIRRHLDHCRPCLCHAEFEGRFQRLLKDRFGSQCCPDTLRSNVLRALRGEAGEG